MQRLSQDAMKYIRYVPYVVAGVIFLVAGFFVARWHSKAAEYERVKPQWEATIKNRDDVIAQERADRALADKIARATQEQLDALEKSHHDDPLPPVRVCPRTSAHLPEAGRASPSASEAVEADDPPADEGNRDIGPELDQFATDAESNLIQCQALQDWVRSSSVDSPN